MRSLFAALETSDAPLHVHEVWTLDLVQSGDSGLLNRELLGDTCA